MISPGFIYVMLRADGLRKLGASVDARRRATQWTLATGVVHSVERVWELETTTVALRIETGLHRLLKHLRINGAGSSEAYAMSLGALSMLVKGSILNASYPVKLVSLPTPRSIQLNRMRELIAESQKWCDEHPEEAEAMVERMRHCLLVKTKENNELARRLTRL